MFKKSLAIILSLVLVILMFGCTPTQEPENTGDSLKIISLSAAFTQIVFDLGLYENLVGVDDYSKDLPEIDDNINSFDMMALNVEQIMTLSPDIIFISELSTLSGQTDPLKPVADAGIEVVYLETAQTISEIYDTIEKIAEKTGRVEKGEELIRNTKTALAQIAQITLQVTEKKSVYFEISPAPDMYSFGKNVYIDEMLEIAGLVNIFATKNSWFSVAGEEIILSQPDVIITNSDFMPNAVDEILARPGWQTVPAVANKQVYLIANSITSLPNHNIVKGVMEIAKAIYPQLFENEQ